MDNIIPLPDSCCKPCRTTVYGSLCVSVLPYTVYIDLILLRGCHIWIMQRTHYSDLLFCTGDYTAGGRE